MALVLLKASHISYTWWLRLFCSISLYSFVMYLQPSCFQAAETACSRASICPAGIALWQSRGLQLVSTVPASISFIKTCCWLHPISYEEGRYAV